MVSDAGVFVSQFLGGAHHVFKGVDTITAYRVCVQVAVNVPLRYELGQYPSPRLADLIQTFSEFGWHELYVEAVVESNFAAGEGGVLESRDAACYSAQFAQMRGGA